MSSQAYYLAQIAIILAAVVIALSAAGFDIVGDSLSTGVSVLIVGALLIVSSVVMVRRRSSYNK